jgi:hypothetical protein
MSGPAKSIALTLGVDVRRCLTGIVGGEDRRWIFWTGQPWSWRRLLSASSYRCFPLPLTRYSFVALDSFIFENNDSRGQIAVKLLNT